MPFTRRERCLNRRMHCVNAFLAMYLGTAVRLAIENGPTHLCQWLYNGVLSSRTLPSPSLQVTLEERPPVCRSAP
jgi:hypothetical protein